MNQPPASLPRVILGADGRAIRVIEPNRRPIGFRPAPEFNRRAAAERPSGLLYRQGEQPSA